ncbi:hypothetical protein [Croceivirga sp. JEA036]|uniref:hypothetical protein n=1 Tax=Croceivirga sp. JEA036 TaxID=2721162 RepID=UPI0014396EE4|nr:hypothetical protein [Croceivirga sp. JEA036]NJB35378.1 hypothetical protein [Croceivirga sp. JEA036]
MSVLSFFSSPLALKRRPKLLSLEQYYNMLSPYFKSKANGYKNQPLEKRVVDNVIPLDKSTSEIIAENQKLYTQLLYAKLTGEK